MNQDDRQAALSIVNDCQQRCASVTVQIGHTADNGQVRHNSLLIQDCPPRVINELKQAGFRLSMTDKGLWVDT